MRWLNAMAVSYEQASHHVHVSCCSQQSGARAASAPLGGGRCSQSFLQSFPREIDVREDRALSPCKASNRVVPETKDTGVRHSRHRGQKIQGQVLLKLSICKGKKAEDEAVCRVWGGTSQIMPCATFVRLATFLALFLKEYFSEENGSSRKPCMEK